MISTISTGPATDQYNVTDQWSNPTVVAVTTMDTLARLEI